MALDQRQQKLIVVGFVFVAAAAAFWYLQYSPKTKEIATNRIRLDSLDKRNKQVQRLVSGGTLQQYRDETVRFQRELSAMRKLVPSAAEVPTLVDGITSAARSAGLDISDVAPAGQVPGDGFDVFKYALGVTGPYHRVAEFIANIGSMERIVVPINLSLVMGPPQIGDRKPRRNEVFVTATFGIQTYVAKEAPPAPPAPPGGGGP